ncbi:MAG: hypothetical protein E7665_06625 [Ruminococcaceae bacterium]|nr:hypothetical protein [Oscillospiraceae bacterium]
MKGTPSPMKHFYSFTFLLVAVFIFVSCSSGGYTIRSIDDDGMDISYENTEIRVDFLKDVPPVTEEESGNVLVNVRDFGAVGDGVTDDTKSCQAAMREVNYGGTLYFPAGTYFLSRQLYIYGDNVTVKGDGNATKLIYKREQKTIDSIESISLFGARKGVFNISICDMYMEYQGEFFPNFGDSYTGKINALYFTEIHDLLVENVEITGFNSSGINIAGLSDAYATDIVVKDCYLHHNRVAGVMFGFVDGLIITGSVMEYMGSNLDGGTGYGSAGLSGAFPKNIRILNNEHNFNQRKGVDLHAGENVIIEGNTCKANRLYGVCVVGKRVNHIIIKNNFITDMDREKLDIGDPYTWNNAIGIGTAQNDPDTFYDFQVVGNVIENYGLGEGRAYGIQGYGTFSKGRIVIKDNIMHCNEIDNFITFSADTVSEKNDVNFIVDGNQMYAKTALNNTVKLGNYNSLIFTNNILNIETQPVGIPIYLTHDKNVSNAVINYNNITFKDTNKSPIYITNKSSAKSLICENNVFNEEKF